MGWTDLQAIKEQIIINKFTSFYYGYFNLKVGHRTCNKSAMIIKIRLKITDEPESDADKFSQEM